MKKICRICGKEFESKGKFLLFYGYAGNFHSRDFHLCCADVLRTWETMNAGSLNGVLGLSRIG